MCRTIIIIELIITLATVFVLHCACLEHSYCLQITIIVHGS